MTHCGPILSEVLYFGTSGWSPQPGGILNPPQCEKANWKPKVARMGDVCVSPLSVNWACHKGSWAGAAAGYPDQCYDPKESNGPADSYLFGQCQFFADNIKDNLDLADDVIAAVKKSSFPPRSINVTSEEHLYWATMAEGVRQPLPDLPHDSPPNVWGYHECMEVDAQFFYSGSPFEFKARQYAADTLNTAIDYLGLGHTASLAMRHEKDFEKVALASSSPVSAEDLIAVTAMEITETSQGLIHTKAVGVSEALLRYNSLHGSRSVPFTNIRTLSNWNVQPITRDSKGRWVTFKDLPEDFATGYSHAIATGSTAILAYHQSKCLKDTDVKDTNLCDFQIDPLEHEQLVRLGRSRAVAFDQKKL